MGSGPDAHSDPLRDVADDGSAARCGGGRRSGADGRHTPLTHQGGNWVRAGAAREIVRGAAETPPRRCGTRLSSPSHSVGASSETAAVRASVHQAAQSRNGKRDPCTSSTMQCVLGWDYEMRSISSTVAALASLVLCVWVDLGSRAHAEVREVSIAEVVKEFCDVVVANEAHYSKLIESCFPNASQDADTRNSCRAVVNSVTTVMNEFFRYRESLEVRNHYRRMSFDWAPPPNIVERWNCKVSRGSILTEWNCPGFRKEDVEIASQEPICADALEAEDRIGELIGNAGRADRLLTVKALRVIAEETKPIVAPDWSIDGGSRSE